MSEILLCEANISEGRDQSRLGEIVDSVGSTRGVRVVDRSADPDHNRAVISFLGAPEHVLSAAIAMTLRAFELIDMTEHHGEHPRLGAVDVVPFVPVREIDMDGAVAIARRFGHAVGDMGVPVYFYEAAATRPERRRLPDIRRGGYEGLEEKLRDPEWQPDAGPPQFNPSVGAVITGARGPLVRVNVNLRAPDVRIARRIARAVRESSGGIAGVRALGFDLRERGLVQVSINLTDYQHTPLETVLEAVRAEAEREGAEVDSTEIVGTIPIGALEGTLRRCLHADRFSTAQILELALPDGGGAGGARRRSGKRRRG